MILIDLNQLMISNILRHLKADPNKMVNPAEMEGLIRHKIIQHILYVKKKFGQEYGEPVICCDSRSYWRRTYFPYYKAHRKNDREASEFDWNKIHSFFDIFKAEIKAYLPYVMIEVDGTEADDVIAVLSKHYHDKERILIYSSDKDFLQLHRYSNVDQYSPNAKEMLTVDDPIMFLKEHIITGDRGDGIPNILNADDIFVTDEKPTRLYKKTIDKWLKLETNEFCTPEMQAAYNRNETLIDLTKVPNELVEKIIYEYEHYKTNPKNKMLTYFIQFGLKKLTDKLTEF